MRKAIILVVIVMTALATGAQAQVSPCMDGMGVYFDTGATSFNISYPGGFAPLNVYLLLTRPSGDFIREWECQIVETNNFTVPGTWALNGGLDIDGDATNFVVGMGATPHPAGPSHTAVMLASKTMYGASSGAGSAATFTVKGVPESANFPGGQPGYVYTPGIHTPCTTLTGSLAGPHACINSNCPIIIDCGYIDNETFAVAISASIGGYIDTNNVAAANRDASDDFDPAYDIPEPPSPPVGFVQLAFTHPEWESPVGDIYRTDFRLSYLPVSETKIWPLRFLTDQSGEATLVFVPNFDQTTIGELYLADLATGDIIELWNVGLSFSFIAEPNQIRRFDLLVGPRPYPPLEPTYRDIPAGWSMVGMPLVADNPGTLGSVLFDDATSEVYIYDYTSGVGYQQQQQGHVVVPGKGYWVGAITPFSWTMEGELDLNGVLVPLDYGWNMLGTPIWTAIDLNDVMVDYQGSRYDYATAVQMNLIGSSAFSYQTSLESYVAQTTLFPWYGCWLPTYQSDVKLWFHYINIGSSKLDL